MILRWYHQLAALAAVVFFAQIGVFFLYAATSCQLSSRYADASIGSATSSTGNGGTLRALVVSDIHLLGKRRRSWIERMWIDWQVRKRVCLSVCIYIYICKLQCSWR